MTKEDFCKFIQQYQDRIKRMDELFEPLEKILDFDWSCEVKSNFDRLILDLLANASGIHREAIDWFISENEFGERGSECSNEDGKTVAITSSEVFWDFEKEAL